MAILKSNGNTFMIEENATSSDHMIIPNNLSLDILKYVLGTVHVPVEDIEDNRLLLDLNDITVLVEPHLDNDTIMLITIFQFDDDFERDRCMECANSINQAYPMVSASVVEDHHLWLQYDIPVRGGLTKESFIFTLHRFIKVCGGIFSEYKTILKGGEDMVNVCQNDISYN